MAYDRYDRGSRSHDDRGGWSGNRHSLERERGWRGDEQRGSRDDQHGGHGERGFFERAGDEIASWFGSDDDRGRGHREQMHERRPEYGQQDSSREQNRDYDRGYGRDIDRDGNAERSTGQRPERDWSENRGPFATGGSSERDYNRDWRQENSGRDFSRERADREPNRGWTDRYQPMTGDYGRGSSGGQPGYDERSQSQWARDDYRGTSRAGSANWSDRSREDHSGRSGTAAGRSGEDRHDPHYHSWRDRHLSELDRDYDDYRAEHQSKFESDFGSWRERRQQKRSLLSQIREHMEVVASDKKHVGTVEKVAGDRLILAKSDPQSGGGHHSLSCSEIDRIDGDKVILDCSADQARERWRDESRSRALFERDDQGESGPHALDRSFQGTYR